MDNKVSIIAQADDWKAALRDVADLDQLSPEYGGTGRSQADLPSLADALYSAGSHGGAGTNQRNVNDSSQNGCPLAVVDTGVPKLHEQSQQQLSSSRNVERNNTAEEAMDRGAVTGDAEVCGKTKIREASLVRTESRENGAESESESIVSHGWFSSAWGTVDWLFSGWGGSMSDGGETGMPMLREREASGLTHDEEVGTVGIMHALLLVVAGLFIVSTIRLRVFFVECKMVQAP